MTSCLPFGYRADRGNPDKRKSRGASKKQVSSWYQPFDLVEWGSRRRDSHLANDWSSLKLSLAYNAVHCVTDPRPVRALLKDKLETDVEKNPGPASRAQRQARNTRRKRRRVRRRVKKIRKLQKDWVKGNKTIATWNVPGANIHGGRFGKIVKLYKQNGTDITFVTELNTFSHGIKKFETDGESMYLLQSMKKGVLMRGKLYRKWETEGRKWYPADGVTTVEFRDSILSSVYQPVRGSAQYEQQIQEVRRDLERVMHGGYSKASCRDRGGGILKCTDW